jgi:hypothetical protein
VHGDFLLLPRLSLLVSSVTYVLHAYPSTWGTSYIGGLLSLSPPLSLFL